MCVCVSCFSSTTIKKLTLIVLLSRPLSIVSLQIGSDGEGNFPTLPRPDSFPSV